MRLLAAAGLAGLAGACSFTLPVSTAENEPQTTQSISVPRATPLSPDLGDEDWRRAKAALAVALDPQGSGARVAWDNPDSGARGEFTPVAQPFVKSDEICRAFLASLSGPQGASRLQGTACRPSGGEWVLKDVKPYKGT